MRKLGLFWLKCHDARHTTRIRDIGYYVVWLLVLGSMGALFSGLLFSPRLKEIDLLPILAITGTLFLVDFAICSWLRKRYSGNT